MWNSLADGLLLREPQDRCRRAGFLVYPCQVDLNPEQRALEEQGFLAITSVHDYERGTVLPELHRWGTEEIPGPLVILGTATYAEWKRQFLKYYGDDPRGHGAGYLQIVEAYGFRFYKVGAE